MNTGGFSRYMGMSKREVIVPTNLDEIPLSAYLAWKNDPEESEEGLRALALNLFCDLTYSEIEEMPFQVAERVSDRLSQTLSKEGVFRDRFELNGIKYGFIPNLDNISLGEYIDIDNALRDEKEMWKVMSVLYRPVIREGQGDRYEIAPWSGIYQEAFKFMPSGIAIGAMVFFCDLGLDLLSYILKYYEEEKRRQTKRGSLSSIRSTKSGGGWDSSIYSLREMFSKWTTLRERNYRRLSCGEVTRQTWRRWKRKRFVKRDENEGVPGDTKTETNQSKKDDPEEHPVEEGIQTK